MVELPFRLDEVDVAILRALLEDGRMPLNQIAKLANVSTPTVEARLRKMVDMGLIKRIAALLDTSKIRESVAALISLKTSVSNLEETVKQLSQMNEIKAAYLTLGDSNVTLMVTSGSVSSLQDFIAGKLASVSNLTIVSSNIISKVVKEDQTVDLKPGLGVVTKCDTCGAEIAGEPITWTVGGHDRFFCCKVCLSTYKEKYESKIKNILTKEDSVSR